MFFFPFFSFFFEIFIQNLPQKTSVSSISLSLSSSSSNGGARAESRRRAKFVELHAVTGCVLFLFYATRGGSFLLLGVSFPFERGSDFGFENIPSF